MGVSVLECRLTLKYWSKVVIAVSKTTWQFGQRSKWRLMAVSAEGASFPSKYQQIKWIVSLQVIVYFPQDQDFKLRPEFVSAIGAPEIIKMLQARKTLKKGTVVAVSGPRAAFVSTFRLKTLHASVPMPENRSWILGEKETIWRGEMWPARSPFFASLSGWEARSSAAAPRCGRPAAGAC